jgi:hypothetical protein
MRRPKPSAIVAIVTPAPKGGQFSTADADFTKQSSVGDRQVQLTHHFSKMDALTTAFPLPLIFQTVPLPKIS